MTDLATVSPPERPYRGIQPFRYADRGVFFARDGQTSELVQFVSVYRGVLLYGESGAGKSSLVNAGLIPALGERQYVPERYRVQPLAGHELVLEPIAGWDEEDRATLLRGKRGSSNGPDVVPLSKFVERCRNLSESERLLLIFDQFEEIITLFQEAPQRDDVKRALEVQKSIVGVLTELLNDPSLRVKLLFVFREDYLGQVLKLFRLSPYLRDQYVRLTPPPPEALLKIIRGPFEEFPERFRGEISTELAEELASALAKRTESDEVNLSEVQIVCLRLWDSHDPEALFREKGVRGLLEDHMDDALSGFDEENKYAAVELLSRMITGSGARNVISEEDLVERVHKAAKISKRKLKKTLQALEKAAVVRRERRHGSPFYEIVSEFLVSWIVRQREERLARQQLERLFLQITEEELDYHDRLFRVFRRSKVAAVLSLAVLVAAALAVVGLAVFSDGLPFWAAAIVVTLPLAGWALVQAYTIQRSAEYRDATVRLATQRREISALVGEAGGLTGGQVSEIGKRLDDYAAEPVRWE